MWLAIIAVGFSLWLIALREENKARHGSKPFLSGLSTGAKILVVLLVMNGLQAQVAGGKGATPVGRVLRLLFFHADDIWPLADAVRENEAAAATNAVTAQILAAASNTLAEVGARVATQDVWTVSFGWPMGDRTPAHEEQNVMGEKPARSNVWINGELYHDHYVAFNALVGTNPAILSVEYSARTDAGAVQSWWADVTTNSYPSASVIQLEHGAYTCYWFRCKCPTALTNSVIDDDREVIFGAPPESDRGFNIAGVFVVSRDGQLWQGRTYTNVVDGLTNIVVNGINALKED